MESTLASRHLSVVRRIGDAAARAGRDPASVTLIAVSKTMPASAIREAYAAGVRDFGENKVQELIAKREELADLAIRWHMIGHLQRNKTRQLLAGPTAILHSVDSEALAAEVHARTPEGRIQPIMIQVNTSGEETKFGVAPAGAEGLVASVRALPRLRLLGLMTLGPLTEDEDAIRASFRLLSVLRERHFPAGGGALSMGMSGDFEIAIEEGATHVRVGTALFGQRG